MKRCPRFLAAVKGEKGIIALDPLRRRFTGEDLGLNGRCPSCAGSCALLPTKLGATVGTTGTSRA